MSERADGTPEPTPDGGGGATAYGSSAAVRAPGPGEPTAPAPDSTAPEYATGPVAFRRPAVFDAMLLVLACVAAGISLLLPWLSSRDDSGMELVRRGFSEFGHLGDTGFSQSLALVLGGRAGLLLGGPVFL